MKDEIKLVQEPYNVVINFLVNYSFQLVGAIIIIIGLFVIIALSKLGVSINPFIVAIGGLAVGASFALQGPVSNYGAGLMIILTRLYKVGDSITIQGCFGIVKEITLSITKLETEDGEMIVIPNRQVTGEIHKNSFANRIMEGVIGISYSDSPETAVKIIHEALNEIDGASKENKPLVGIIEFADSSINIEYRIWLSAENYYSKLYEVNLKVFNALNNAKINIPFPQREIKMLS